jgi:chromate reductase, NAD(P)H dehydrogenase (quinone)
MKILAVSGSLRHTSRNTSLLRAAMLLAPQHLEITLSDHLESLPHFNPDLETTAIPTVDAWRDALRAADLVLISSPEYAHGIPGALKNALDWCVGSGEFVGKPVNLLNASSGGAHAQAQLREVLTTMDARVLEDSRVALMGANLTPEEISTHELFSSPLKEMLEGFSSITSDPKVIDD